MIKLNLKGSVLPVELTTDDKAEAYELREMSGATRDSYLDFLQQRIKTGAGGKTVEISKFDGMQADLISRCLYRQADGQLVQKAVIQKWPASVVVELFENCQTLNSLKLTQAQVEEVSKNA